MRRRLLALALLLLAPLSAAAEDVLVLRNGREVRGKIVEEKDDLVKIDVGGGKMTYRREQIREVRRESAVAEAPPAEPGRTGAATPFEPGSRRDESAVLYVDGERAGTRVLRTTKIPEGWLFEEEVRLLDAKGAPKLEIRTTERDDPQYRPLSFQVRETDGGSVHRSVAGEVSAGLLRLTFATNGAKEKKDLPAPDDARFPFAARELYLREAKALGGKLETKVFDLRTGATVTSAWRDAPPRPLRIEGRSLEARVVLCDRAGTVQREWLDRDGSAVFAELDGGKTLAVACSNAAVERLRRGDTDRVTGQDSAGRTVYADKVRGWRIGKADPSWTFEKPENAGPGALLVVRNEPLFATVDVQTDPDAPPRVTLEEASDALTRLLKTIAPDFRIHDEGEVRRDGVEYWRMDASATTKGEKTRTLARVFVKDGRVFRVLAACPDAAFATLRPDLEKILESFRFE